MKKESEEYKKKLITMAFEMLLEEDRSKNTDTVQRGKKALVQKKIKWIYFEKYGDAVGSVFIMNTNKGAFLFKVGGGNISYTPV